MKITLRYPFGDYEPGSVVDVDPKLGELLCRERFARRSAEADEVELMRRNPTVAELRDFATRHGMSMHEAKRVWRDRRGAAS